jgi:hypothetical protein
MAGFAEQPRRQFSAGLASSPAFLDILLLCGGRLYALELKSEAGKLTDAQIAAHERLAAAGARGRLPVGTLLVLQRLARSRQCPSLGCATSRLGFFLESR